ncbi:MAG: PEP-CTERM sorting domain-containing protein [Limnoraphis robusta]
MNVRVVTRYAVVALSAVFACGAVDVSPVEAANLRKFDFSGLFKTAPSFDFTVDDLTVNVTANAEDGTGQVRQTVGGLGVFDGRGRGREIDAAGGIETLFLDFGEKVSLVSATFGYVDGNDAFNLFVGNNPLLVGMDIPDSNVFDFSSFDSKQISAQTFSFTANLRSDYSLQSITVATVPEPTTVFALMAVGGLGSVALKRKS